MGVLSIRKIFLAGGVLCPYLLFSQHSQVSGELLVHFYNVGQADAILIRTLGSFSRLQDHGWP